MMCLLAPLPKEKIKEVLSTPSKDTSIGDLKWEQRVWFEGCDEKRGGKECISTGDLTNISFATLVEVHIECMFLCMLHTISMQE